jgi:hypothetical protein
MADELMEAILMEAIRCAKFAGLGKLLEMMAACR